MLTVGVTATETRTGWTLLLVRETDPFCLPLPRAAQADDRTLASLGCTSGPGLHLPTLLKQEFMIGSWGEKENKLLPHYS